MAALRSALVCVLFVSSAFAATYPTQLVYQKNQVLTYNIDARLDARGYDDIRGFTSGGGYSTMNGLMVVQVVDIDTDYYFMSMNMYNVDVASNNTNVPRSITSGDQALGDICFIWQSFNGTVLRVAFSRNDPDFFIEVKLGAANSLQTHIVAPGDKAQLLTLDPVGAYVANVSAVGTETHLVITKNFTQSNVVHFTDPTVDPNNVVISAGTVTGVTMAGVISSAAVDQFVQLVNVNDAPTAEQMMDAPANGTSSLDVNFASRGSLLISLQSPNGPSPFNASQLLTPQQVMESKQYMVSTLFQAGVRATAAKRVHESRIYDIDAQIKAFVAKPKNERVQWKLARYFAARPAEAMAPLETILKSDNKAAIVTVLHLLSLVNTADAQTLFVKYGVESRFDVIRRQAIISSFSFTRATPALVRAVRSLSVEKGPLSRMATIALGALYSRSDNAKEAATDLLPRLRLALKKNVPREITAALYAIANAGPEAISSDELVAVLAASHVSNDRSVVRAVDFVVNQYRAAAQVVADANNSDLPFNHTWGGGIIVGGRKINAGFNSTTFAGTNFNCNQTYFNYEIIGTSASNVTLFRWHTTSFFSQTIYGLINGQPAADHIIVMIFGKVFYEEPLPSVDCFQETIPIFTQSTGLNKQYTLWISVIPVTFTATVSLTLNLDVQFEACLDKLSASVSLLPTATLSFSGGAEVNLLIVKAGIRLEGSFESTLVPEVYVYGSECEVGVQATLQVPPQEVALEGYSDIDICVLWVFDCHWGQEYDHKFLDWSYAGENKILFNEEWKIHL